MYSKRVDIYIYIYTICLFAHGVFFHWGYLNSNTGITLLLFKKHFLCNLKLHSKSLGLSNQSHAIRESNLFKKIKLQSLNKDYN